jgi:Ca2+-binding EF-hand superfamily protein
MRCFDGVELEEFTPEEKAAMEKRERLTQLFQAIDTDSSGTVGGAELREGLLRRDPVTGVQICQTEAEVTAILLRGDGDGDGDLTLPEFLNCFPDLADNTAEEESGVQRLTNLFHSIDDDQTGWVDSQELYEGMRGAGVNASAEEIAALLKAGDDDGDGRLTLEEFLTCFEYEDLDSWFDAAAGVDLEAVERAAKLDDEQAAQRYQAAMQMFQMMDEDQSGWVSSQEVITGMAKLQMPGGGDEVRNLLESADTDGDGKIEFDEFLAWFEKRFQEQKRAGRASSFGNSGGWWLPREDDGAASKGRRPRAAPLDIKDGLGEMKKGDVPVCAETTLLAVGGLRGRQ